MQWAIQGGFAGFINGQPVEPSGQQQVCPTANTTYRLEVDAGNQMHVREINIAVSGGGGGNSSSSGNPGVIQIITGVPMESAKYDIGLINLFARSGDGKIMVTIKNTGNQTWTKSYTLSCIGDWRTCDVCNYASSSKTENITLAVGDIHNTSTGFSLNANLTSQKVTCTLATSDSNSSNNSIGPTSVK
ncbi:MAG: hypothetical protein HGA79_02865 [Anaerolineales bacterium]|nr:hypothetical protein [Anaerolineales bacterium]